MSIIYDWYEAPRTALKQQEEGDVALYPRIPKSQTVDIKSIAKEIQDASSFTASDVQGVMVALSELMKMHLAMGNTVHIEGIGYFKAELGTLEKVTASTKFKGKKVYVDGVGFKPDKQLLRQLQRAKLVRTKTAWHSVELSDEMIEQGLTSHFASVQLLTVKQFCFLFNQTESTARRRISSLVDAGKLKNIGHRPLALYVPCPGCFGK